MLIGKVLSEYESNGLPKLPPGFMGTHFIRTDDRIHKILTLESSWKGENSNWSQTTQITNLGPRRSYYDRHKISALIRFNFRNSHGLGKYG